METKEQEAKGGGEGGAGASSTKRRVPNAGLDADIQVWACGCNEMGLMGLPERDLFNVCVQVPLPGDAMAVDVEAGKFYSMLLTKDGRLMACGLQEDHQLPPVNMGGRKGTGEGAELMFTDVTPPLEQEGQGRGGARGGSVTRFYVDIAAGEKHSMFVSRPQKEAFVDKDLDEFAPPEKDDRGCCGGGGGILSMVFDRF